MNQNFGCDASITLGEAIQKLRTLEHEDDMTNQMSAEVTQALEQHDAVHVLFNCGTSIREEIAVHLWMLLATTARVGEMHRAVASVEHKSVLSNIGHFKLLSIWFTSLPRIMGIIFKSLRMKKRLSMEEMSQLKEKPLLEIRREYGIIL